MVNHIEYNIKKKNNVYVIELTRKIKMNGKIMDHNYFRKILSSTTSITKEEFFFFLIYWSLELNDYLIT